MEFLGYQSTDAAHLKNLRFEALVDDTSRMMYHDVQRRRREREEVAPYHLTLKRADGGRVEVRVVSADIPSEANELPETFGILISRSENNVVPIDLVQAARRSARLLP